jgi:hypothetical protein
MDANDFSTAAAPAPAPAAALPDVDADLLERARVAAADHPELGEALRRLDLLGQQDVEHHPSEFEAIHDLLRAALGGSD